MATRIRTLNFLPEIFKTPTNSQFLAATLDQLVAQPNTKRIEGYIGSKFGYGVNATDNYVVEPTKVRTDYQLEPGVVFTKANDTTATDFISYPGIIDALKLQGGLTADNNRLFNSQFYSWDSFTELDKIINFNQYYWLPEGPEQVTITTEVVYTSDNYTVQDLPNGYLLSSDTQPAGSINPTITLLRGGSYTFSVSQNTQFWIQGAPGVTGYSPIEPNVQTRDVFGVINNGATNGLVTFNVPLADAQSSQNIPGNIQIGVVSTLPFSSVNGARVSDIAGIDGITSLDGLTLMFYDTGVEDEFGYVQPFYDETTYDENGGVAYDENTDYPGSSIYDNNFEGGYYTQVNSTFYLVTLVGDPTNPTIQLSAAGVIPTNQKITPQYGTEWVNRNFYRNVAGSIQLVSYNSAILDTLYYQDGTSPNKVGIIKIVDSNNTNQLNIITSILGKKQYTSPTGVAFTNGLKVIFQGDIYPDSYRNVQYYVEGVGSAIELIPVQDLVSPGLFAEGSYIPYDTTPYDIGNYDASLYVPIVQDYITIARNAINKNAWSRSNRWFHIDVINASAEYNNDPSLVTTLATLENKAKRPIIEFYPNLRLFDSGVYGKQPIDFIDFKTTDAFSLVAGKTEYYPDTAGYTGYAASILPVNGAYSIIGITAIESLSLVNQVRLSATDELFINDTIEFASSFGGLTAGTAYYITSIDGLKVTLSETRQGDTLVLTSGTPSTTSTTITSYSTTINVPNNQVFGLFQENQYIVDNTNVLPNNSQIVSVTVGATTEIVVTWYNESIVLAATDATLVSADTTLDNYALFDGSRVVFAVDTDDNVRNKIYDVHFVSITGTSTPVITLTEAGDGLVLPDEQTAVFRGYNYQGKDFYFTGIEWREGQQKITVNQPPKFDVFDSNGVSFGDALVYLGTSFTGSTLFGYGIGTGSDDPIIGFPLRYSSVDNVGDISFDVTLNSDTFNYVSGFDPITQNVNTGYVYNYKTRTEYVRELGWQTAVSPSIQYQIFEFDWSVATPVSTFTCDIAPVSTTSTNWPVIQVYINNQYQDPATAFTYTTTSDSTIVSLTVDSLVDTVVQVLILSDQVSATAYYEVPINLNNNPFNADVTTVNIGDIRGQYQSIFYNNPDTTGTVFGANNYRDLGNLVPWGNKIIQNSASLALPGAFLRKQDHSLFNALLYNNRQYITFKTLIIDTINNTDYPRSTTPAQILDDALDQITASKTDSEPFFWSDMLPSKAPYISNSYSFANSLDVSIYPLSKVYDFAKANYNGVLVYLTRNGVTTQLITGVDYIVSIDSPSLTVTKDLLPNDQITINEYNQTYGSYAPNTPTKLGLYPATIPSITLDSAYSNPTYFVVGHDGSYNKLYGNYNPTTGRLDDYRDQALLEYETRVYNNLKLSNVIPIEDYEVTPGFFRDTDYSYDEILEIYSEGFLNWVGQNRMDYKTQFYNASNEYTYNYRDSGNKINQEAIQQGYWRGLYEYYYDTSVPDTSPWQMIGYPNQPTWWETRYGPAPYTSDNLILWEDLAAGLDWNDGVPVIRPQYIRSELLEVIPVDSEGNLVSPFVSIVGNYTNTLFRRDWKVGDVGPTEFSYRRSSSYPFDLMRILALTKPAKFYNLAVDLDNYKFNEEFNQYLVNDRSHLNISNVEIYGSGTAKTSYINWIVDYEKQVGVDATTNITNLLDQLDVRLVYRLAGFSDKDMLKFYVEKSSANSNNSSLLIPDESYAVLLYDNQPFDRIVYSGVVIQIVDGGYTVFGNSQTNAYFTVSVPVNNGNKERLSIDALTVVVANDYYENKTVEIPYGTKFYSVQEVAQFLGAYGNHLETQGMKFDQIENGIPVTWTQMINEFLYWAQIGWEVGSITTINPSATLLAIDKDSNIVQPLTLRQQNFVLNQNLYPIQSVDLSIVREGTAFTAQPLNQGDAISYGQFNIGNIEHGIVFDNVTLFNDIIYNLTTGLRQNRITLRGTKTADWNGTVDAYGFILNQDNIVEWSKEVKYTKGSIVKYKNKYWTALTIIQAKELFDERDWKQTDYNEIQKGLLPNSSTRSYESTIYYDVNKPNLENDADLLSFSLIGYRPRDYLAIADLTDITQVNVYKNLIKNKGTLDAASAFKGATLAQGGIDYDIYENWAIASGEFGGVLNNNFIEFRLQESLLTGNPSIVGLTDGTSIDGVQQEVPTYSLFNYARPISSPDVLPTIASNTPTTLLPTAGYVNFNDVKMSSYFYSGLPTARDASGKIIPITDFYVRDYTWLANYLEAWKVLTPKSLGSIVNAKNNLNGTVTITFSTPHNLTRYQLFGIVNFDPQVNNYYLASAIVDPYKVLINLTLPPATLNITGLGVGFKMQNQRVATPANIIDLPLLDNEFNKVKVWTDTNNDGDWAVYRKSLNYQYENYQYNTTLNRTTPNQTFGSAVAYTSDMAYLIGDSDAGTVYRYSYDTTTNSYIVDQTLENDVSFGSTISYSDDTFVISEPTSGTPKVYVYQLIRTTQVDNIEPYQVIDAPAGVTTWGTATAISGDKNWLYISDIDNNTVYAYRKNNFNIDAGNFVVGNNYTIVSEGTTDFTLIGATSNDVGTSFMATGVGSGTGVATDTTYKQIDTITVPGSSAGDAFGSSISTDYYGETVIIGAPFEDYDGSTENYGYSYVISRPVQNFEVQFTSSAYVPQTFMLSWTPAIVTQTATATTASTDTITVTSTSGFNVGDPVVFSGTILSGGALSANTVYYIASKTSTEFTVSATRNGSTIQLATASSGSMTVTVQTTPLSVSVNGTTLSDNQYAVIDESAGPTLYVYNGSTPLLNVGDIITVGSSEFVLAQTLDNGKTPRIGVEFGTSIDTNNYANEILIGAPFDLDTENNEGAVHRFTNGGKSYGIIVGTSDCNVTTQRYILLNGYEVMVEPGNADGVAQNINVARIPNITASNVNGKLVLELVDSSLAIPNNKLALTVLNSATLGELGIEWYTETQVITCPHVSPTTQFGSVVKFNEFGSFVTSAPTATRYSATTFDFVDDELDNDTIFDNNTTQFIDTFVNAGAVYMFDYLAVYNESISNPGVFVYAQSTNDTTLTYGAQPLFGQALDFNDNVVTIGTPNFKPGDVNGQVISYLSTISDPDWAVYRSSSPVVDINGIKNIQLFSAETNNTLINLDYIDPLQGKILGAVRENIDVISNIDPASYNSPGITQSTLLWATDKVGKIWFDTSNTRFVNYHQNDVSYNSKYWGRVFPGSDVAVYSWISSNVPPLQYQGPGTPYSVTNYTIQGVLTPEGTITPVYYFWARNTNIVFEQLGKTLADSIIQSYIAQPQSSGISYFTPLLPSVFGLYNSQEYINASDTVLSIGFNTGSNDDVGHNLYNLIRANYKDDFLPGLPSTTSSDTPRSLYARLLDSLSGTNDFGSIVPDPFLPKAVQTGVLVRPRQSFFNDRFEALNNYLSYFNTVLLQYPFVEISASNFLYKLGEINPSTGQPFFDVQNYVDIVNWWAPGYNDNTKSALQVPIYADLSTLSVAPGTIVTVATNGAGQSETYILNMDGSWTRIGLANGTVQINSSLWDYSTANIGFGGDFYDTTPYDSYPSEETRWIVRALNEELPQDLLIFRNKALILLFEYIQSETIENQNYLPWLNKTSFIDVAHTIRELRPIEVFRSDNQTFLEGYLNEAKPYHVVIKEFLFKYTGIDVFEGDITDFDLPAQYDPESQTFVSPQLVYSDPNGVNQFLPSDPIWQTYPYNQWFNNYGVSIVGELGYQIAVLESYVSLNANILYINNANGFPVNGVITLGTEQIAYSSVDLANNSLSGLTRGVNDTNTQLHVPGELIYIDLPPVLVLNSGRGYGEPPRVTAYIDTTIYPAPRVPAQLAPIMSIDRVIGVEVIDPGEGYVVLPEIVIDPAINVIFDNTQVNTLNSTIELDVPLLNTGDLVQYNPTAGSTQIEGLLPGQKYYVGVLENSPDTIIALYNNYRNAVHDQDRILLLSRGTGSQSLAAGADASCITSAIPVRENSITLRFDRTSYSSQVQEWTPGSYYGSFYAGSISDASVVASSSITLQSTNPPVVSVLSSEDPGLTQSAISASATGAFFPIMDVTNDQQLTWSSRTRDLVATFADDRVRIQASEGGASLINSETDTTPTIGFYVGMPVKFSGALGTSGITDNTIYYVKTIVDGTDITLSSNAQLSDTVNLSAYTVGAAGATLFVGQEVNTAVVTLNYDGIRTATATTATLNTITAPMTVTGQNGTSNFYQGLPIFFTGAVFGDVIENETYYVTSVIDNQTFTMSTNATPDILIISETNATGDLITCSTTSTLRVNQPVIFDQMSVSGVQTTTFGNIVQGTIYYVSEIVSGTTFTISESVNGTVFALSTETASPSPSYTGCILTSQADCVQLRNATGSMTMNVALPVSPGQITGQRFTLYGSGTPIVNPPIDAVTDLVVRTITATLPTVNRICMLPVSGGITNMYSGMDFTVNSAFGNLAPATTYTVTGTGTTSVAITSTTAGNRLVCANTNVLYQGMPIQFSGTSLGLVELGITYFVKQIVNSTEFTISEELDGAVYDTTADNGDMTGTGDPYITVATPSLTSAVDATESYRLTQEVITDPTFDVSYKLGGYRVAVTSAGEGYAVDNTITILGSELGGTDTTNDLTMTVSEVDASGGVVRVIVNGTPVGLEEKYYLKVINQTQLEVYEDSLMTIPVSGVNFPFSGVVTSTATAIDSSHYITVDDASLFSQGDQVVFTGSVFGGLTLGNIYYVYSVSLSSGTITVVTEIGDTTPVGDVGTGSMTIGKTGDYALIPQPFYFDSSIVKYNNRLYQCIVSNNDEEFIFGKWELLTPGDRRLNALDRIVGYYKPNKTDTEAWNQYINMPGDDLTQLVSGITYPNSTYLGNAFAPADEYTLDTILQDQPFYPTGINMVGVIWNGTSYVAVSNTSSYSPILFSEDTSSWDVRKISTQPIAVTSVVNTGEKYVITTNNNATPILVSDDGITWTDLPDLAGKSYSLNYVAYNNGVYVAVGNVILTSTDAITWTETYSFTGDLPNTLNSVSWESTPGFTGFIAVGIGQYLNGGNATNVAIVRYSYEGTIWYQSDLYGQTNGFNSVAGNNFGIVAVGDSGIAYTSFDGVIWFQQTTDDNEDLYSVIWSTDDNQFVAVGANGSIQTGDISGSNWTAQTSDVTEDLRDVIYYDGRYVTVGYNNTVIKSTDAGVTWTDSASFIPPEPFYTIQGDAFTAGYGPEEMVPGVVTDALTMTVWTRPGTNWDVTIYQNTGYNVVTREHQPTVGDQTVYSFLYQVSTPAQLSVFIVDYATGLSRTIYEGSDYTVDWINKTITLAEPLTFITVGTADTLRVDVYEVGNGDQLVKANTETDPIVENTTTGFQEIVTNANYSATVWQGSGVIRPTTEAQEAIAFATDATTDTITLDDVTNFIINGSITFSGDVFGGIVEDQVYYVKTISYVSNRITLSETYNSVTGTAGPTLQLTTDTGTMTAIIQIGTGAVWTDPIVYHNGSKLVLGINATVTRTKASTNTVTTNSTGNMVPGSPIVFSDGITLFNSNIVAHQVYYVDTVYDGNEFTISETDGGPVFELADGTGGAMFVTGDYSIGIAQNGINATIILSSVYDITVDYLAYTLFGETVPTQYGYTIPEVELFTITDNEVSTFSSQAEFNLSNFVGADNPYNAIVEVNGLRQTKSQYDIDPLTNTILFYNPPVAGDSVAITTYNLTDRQYLNTQYGITGSSNAELFNLTVTETTHAVGTYDQDTPTAQAYDQDTPSVVLYDEELNYLTTSDTSSLEINYPIVFRAPTLGGINAGQIYYVVQIIDSTTFVISDQVDGTPFVVTSDSGSMVGIVNGLTVANIVNVSNAIEQSATIVISDTASTGNLITCNSTVDLVSGQLITFKTPVVNAGYFTIGSTYVITSLGTTDWNAIGYSGTPTVGESFITTGIGSGTGQAELATAGNINLLGQMYFINTIPSNTEFTIADQYGDEVALSNSTVSMIAYVGGQPAVRVFTGIDHNLVENSLVRIDGTLGSFQLNNQTFYAKVITDQIIDLYQEPYNPALYAVNYPVTAVNTYISGGYVWYDRLFTVAATSATRTTASGNRITVASTAGLIVDTPVYFTEINTVSGENLMGGILSDTEYYVYEVNPEVVADDFIIGNQYEIMSLGDTDWNTVAGTISETYAVGDIITVVAIDSGTDGVAEALQEFKIANARYGFGDVITLTDDTGAMNVSQFQQVNVDRLWVTVNGYRVPSSSLRINPYNNLSILTTITTGDEVIITSMIPTATPNEEVYILNVSTTNEGSVYRAETQTRTWLVEPLFNTDDVIYLNDASRITNTIVQEATAEAPVNGIYTFGINANKNEICHITVFNNTTGLEIPSEDFYIEVINLAPVLRVTDGVTTGDTITLNTTEGRLIYINGEQIMFQECDLVNNTVSQLSRGTGGTGEQVYIPKYAEAFGLLAANKMSDTQYRDTWNSYIYNSVEGDPLQISQTAGADFLRVDVT